MPRLPAALIAVAALAAPASASAATLTTDAPCYIVSQTVTVTGSGWTPGTAFGLTGNGVDQTGFADTVGDWTAQLAAPDVTKRNSNKPRTVVLNASQDGALVAKKAFKVVNFIVQPKQLNGDPNETTQWIFGGFLPGKKIYFHVQRGKKVYTAKAGKGAGPCGTLKKRLPRVPAVPRSALTKGKYTVFVDNRKSFKTGGLQYAAQINVT